MSLFVDLTVTHRKQHGSTPGEPAVLQEECRNKEAGLPIPWRKPPVVAVYEFRRKSEDTNKTTTCRGSVVMATITARQSAESIVDEKSVGKISTDVGTVEGLNGRRLDRVAKSRNRKLGNSYECKTDVSGI